MTVVFARSPTQGQPLRSAQLRGTPAPRAPRAARSIAGHGRGQFTELPLPRAEARPDAPPPAEGSPPEVALPSVGERPAPAAPSSGAGHRSRSFRRRLVLHGSSAVQSPGDVADVHVGVQHVGSDDPPHRVDREDKLRCPSRLGAVIHAGRSGTSTSTRCGARRSSFAADWRQAHRRPPVPFRRCGVSGSQPAPPDPVDPSCARLSSGPSNARPGPRRRASRRATGAR